MSFSFKVRGHTKAAATALAVGELLKLTAAQPGHDSDRHVIAAAITGSVAALPEPARNEQGQIVQEIEVFSYGSASGGYQVMDRSEDGKVTFRTEPVTSTGFNVHVSLVKASWVASQEQAAATSAGQ